jgi:4-phospho-D-threonate 3-dehydrogenase / 4-phospho-D-erythronate 3-dehydrogenase
MEKFKIGITIGDMNGIGLEVILKTLTDERILKLCTPVIYGSSKVVSYHKNIVEIPDFQFNSIRSADQIDAGKINIVNCWADNVNITLGKVSDAGGKYAYMALERAVKDLNTGLIDALVTAPIHKKAMQLADFPFAGHTEYITKEVGAKDSLMFMVSDAMRIGLVTNHIPIKDVASKIHKDRVFKKIAMMADTLKIDFGIEKPTIAVLGLNPHAGDDGVIGEEDRSMILPAIEEAKNKGILAFGPFPADGFFGSSQYSKFDGILAMYHDQGLVAFKAISFGAGVNYTAGLPVVRTSPDHGTAFDIAGKNEADPASFRKALFLAIDIAKNRYDYTEMTANPLQKKSAKIIQGEDEVLSEEV